MREILLSSIESVATMTRTFAPLSPLKVCGQQHFVQVEDRPVVKERVER